MNEDTRCPATLPTANGSGTLRCTKTIDGQGAHVDGQVKHVNPFAVPREWEEEPPTQTGAPVAGIIVEGSPRIDTECSICPTKFKRDDVIVAVPTNKGDVIAHAHCFYYVRAETYEGLYNQAWQLLNAAVARHGLITVRQEDVARATAAGFQLEIKQDEDGTIRMRPQGGRLQLVSTMPTKGKPS